MVAIFLEPSRYFILSGYITKNEGLGCDERRTALGL